MNIPKKIHYVWGYKEPKSRLACACIASWAREMPDYEIVEWNENTINFEKLSKECEFFKYAYRIGCWAYIADYIRFKVLHEFGGIYLDTDVQVMKSLDYFRKYYFFAGFHEGYRYGKKTAEYVEGAVLGSVAGHPYLLDMVDFFKNKMMNLHLQYLPYAMNEVLKKYGLDGQVNTYVSLRENIMLFPSKYFYPFVNDEEIDSFHSLLKQNPYTIHWNQNSYSGKMKYYLFMNYRNTLTKKSILKHSFPHFVLWFKNGVKEFLELFRLFY